MIVLTYFLIAMKASYLVGLSLSLVVGSSVFGQAQAQTAPRQLVNILNFDVPKSGEVTVGGCGFPAVNICTPNDIASVNTDPASPLPLIQNDTEYEITSFTYQLLNNNRIPAVWSKTSSSNLFKKVEITNNGRTITFSGGRLKVGKYVRAIRLGGDKDISYIISFKGIRKVR
jgi:hypothetical protein